MIILDLAFIALGAYFASQILLALAFRPAVQEGAARPAVSSPRPSKVRGGEPDVAVILQRNLLGSRVTQVAAPSQVRSEELPVSSLPYTLLGTVVNVRGKKSLAILQGGSGQEQEVYLEGDQVSEGVLLLRVERNRVVLLRNGTEEVLERAEPSGDARRPVRAAPARVAPSAQASAADAAGEITVRQVGEGTFVMDRREVEGVLQDFNRLLTQVRVVPHFADGKPDGFKIFNIRPNSLFSKLGMVNGDVVKRVNGLEITGPEQALQMFAQLREESRITLDLERFRKNLTLQYEIR